MRHLAVIPARAGSKRIPNKNIKDFCGRPMMARPLEAVSRSGLFDSIHVSTDSHSVAELAAELGHPCEFLRNNDLSGDYATVLSVLNWVVEQYEQLGQHFDTVCLVYATAPFLTSEHLHQAHELLRHGRSKTPVVTVAPFPVPVEWALSVSETGLVSARNPEAALVRSQDLSAAYYECAMLFWLPRQALLGGGEVQTYPALPLVIPADEAIDIDTPEDWERAERTFRALRVL